jgi:hypothetical protein
MTGDLTSFTCPVCGRKSIHPDDAANGYCGNCHAFTGQTWPTELLPPGARAWTTVRKVEWPMGPWHAEPDRVQWTDEGTGLPCLITRNPDWGNLCGYVAVRPGHPWHGADRDQVPMMVPGEITWAAEVPPELKPADIPPCDLADPWWLGFDAGHAWETCPGDSVMLRSPAYPGGDPWPTFADGAEYRDFDYMVLACKVLAAQLAAMPSLT